VKAAYRKSQGFTALIILVEIGKETVKPVTSSYVHLIGDEVSWFEFASLLHKSGRSWDGVVIFPEIERGGGPVPDLLASVKLRELEEDVKADPLHINQGHFFDLWGRRMKVEEVTPSASPQIQ
jgi:hypothetical protein